MCFLASLSFPHPYCYFGLFLTGLLLLALNFIGCLGQFNTFNGGVIMRVFFPLWVFFLLGGGEGGWKNSKLLGIFILSELLVYVGIRKFGIILVDDLVYFIYS